MAASNDLQMEMGLIVVQAMCTCRVPLNGNYTRRASPQIISGGKVALTVTMLLCLCLAAQPYWVPELQSDIVTTQLL